MTRFYLTITVLALIGCKKAPVEEAGPPKPPPAPPPSSPAPPPEPAKPPEDVGAGPAAPALPAPKAEDVATPTPEAPSAPEALSDVAPQRVDKPLRQMCARACNKAQQCGTGGASVAACFNECSESITHEKEAASRLGAAGFRAQEACADGPCSAFPPCVEVTAPREWAYLTTPPLSPKAAVAPCRLACDKEAKCDPEAAKAGASGAEGCRVACAATLTSTDLRLAVPRQQLLATAGCQDKACDALPECVKAATEIARPGGDEHGHDSGHDAAPAPAAPVPPQP